MVMIDRIVNLRPKKRRPMYAGMELNSTLNTVKGTDTPR